MEQSYLISTEEALQISGTPFLFCVSPDETVEQLIPNSIFVQLPYNFIEGVQYLQALNLNKLERIVCYGKVNIEMAARTWWILRSLGYENVQILRDGIQAWVKAGGIASAEQPRRVIQKNVKGLPQMNPAYFSLVDSQNLHSHRSYHIMAEKSLRKIMSRGGMCAVLLKLEHDFELGSNKSQSIQISGDSQGIVALTLTAYGYLKVTIQIEKRTVPTTLLHQMQLPEPISPTFALSSFAGTEYFDAQSIDEGNSVSPTPAQKSKIANRPRVSDNVCHCIIF